MSVLGIDIGTSTCKGLALNENGNIIARASLSYAQDVRVEDGAAELPAEQFRDSAFELIRTLADRTQNDPIRAIAFSTHGETLIPVDAHEAALTDAMLSMDRRCAAEAAEMAETVGTESFYRITGTPMHSQYPAPKIMWIKRRRQELARKTAHYRSTQDYLHGTLGVPGFVDYSLGSRFGALDVRRRAWSDEILNCAGLKADELSVPVQAGTAIGTIPDEIARDLHLPSSVKLVAGGHDQPCASLGMGARHKSITISAGSYECAALATDHPLNDEHGMRYGLNSYCHVLPDQYVTLAFFASGLTIQWFIDRFCRYESEQARIEGCDVHEYLERIMPASPTGVCVTPHVYGAMNPEWNENARMQISGMGPEHDTGAMYLAMLEGAAFEMDLNIRVLDRLAGGVSGISISGGGTKSDAWMQLRADIFGREIDCLTGDADASLLGAAILAGVGCGAFSDIAEAQAALKPEHRLWIPANDHRYDAQKAAYLALHRPGLLD